MHYQETLHQFIITELLEEEDAADVTLDDNLLLSGLVNSLGIFRLLSFIEDSFGIHVHPQDVTIENFSTINVMATFLQRQ